MGRITPSFRQLFHSEVEELKRYFQKTLLDKGHVEAFNLLLREAWSAEDHAMGVSNVPYPLDIMNLMANVHNMKCVEQVRKGLRDGEGKMLELERRLERLEMRAGKEQGKKPILKQN